MTEARDDVFDDLERSHPRWRGRRLGRDRVHRGRAGSRALRPVATAGGSSRSARARAGRGGGARLGKPLGPRCAYSSRSGAARSARCTAPGTRSSIARSRSRSCPRVKPSGGDEAAILEEGRALARVRHPNVVTIHGAEVIEGRVGLWMELVPGRTLDQILREGRKFSAERGRVSRRRDLPRRRRRSPRRARPS